MLASSLLHAHLLQMCVLESHLVFVKITGVKFFHNFVRFIFLCFYGLFYCAFSFYFTRVLNLFFTSNLHKLVQIMAFIKNEPLNIKIENAKKELYSRRERQRIQRMIEALGCSE